MRQTRYHVLAADQSRGRSHGTTGLVNATVRHSTQLPYAPAIFLNCFDAVIAAWKTTSSAFAYTTYSIFKTAWLPVYNASQRHRKVGSAPPGPARPPRCLRTAFQGRVKARRLFGRSVIGVLLTGSLQAAQLQESGELLYQDHRAVPGFLHRGQRPRRAAGAFCLARTE